MIEIKCPCGRTQTLSESKVNTDMPCAGCGGVARCVAAEQVPDGTGLGDFDIALKVLAGPDRVGQLLVLGGVEPISLGKLPENHVSLSGGSQVSRRHARLVRLDFGPSRWTLQDQQSRNGVYVNGERITEAELKAGDVCVIGDYRLQLVDVKPEEAPAPAAPTISPAEGTVCKGCQKVYSKKAKICTACGLDLKTGRPLTISRDIDEDVVHVRAENIIRVVSWIMPVGLFPVASEAFGTKKPIATWVTFGITTLVSVWFFFAVIMSSAPSPSLMNLMHWVGQVPDQTELADLEDRAAAAEERLDEAPEPGSYSNRRARRAERQRQEELESEIALNETMQAAVSGEIGMRWWQFFTSALLHADIFHLAGNMLFLLVFGIRVNEALGWWKFTIAYVLLAIVSSAAHWFSSMNGPLTPSLGASGAIKGLAGIYFVFFPVQRVYTAAWIRIRLWFGMKIWRMPGFWLLLLWVVWSDVVPVILKWEGAVAHWAHLGGFIGGMIVAVLLLLTRQATAHGSDLISVVLGHRARKLLGASTATA